LACVIKKKKKSQTEQRPLTKGLHVKGGGTGFPLPSLGRKEVRLGAARGKTSFRKYGWNKQAKTDLAKREKYP
jgi:hypothetical protein